jgi:hypothetical protein
LTGERRLEGRTKKLYFSKRERGRERERGRGREIAQPHIPLLLP